MKQFLFISILFISLSGRSQNMVPNPSFEDTLGCFPGMPHLDCLELWKDNSGTFNPVMNTADLCFNGAVFFPPSSIPAFDGTKYIGLDCQMINPEYVQVQMNSAMIAGNSYCVSFYVSVCDQTDNIAPSLGAFFSNTALTVNPYTAGMSAHVQGVVPADPTIWTKISGTYVAGGGEQFITLGGFQNNTVATSYMYIDMVEVIPMDPLNLGNDQALCPGDQITLDAGNSGTSYLWSTGETTSSINAAAAGTYWVEKITGSCSLADTIILFTASCNEPPPAPVDSVIDGTFFIPNSFSPNGDGMNDLFGPKGENIYNFEMTIYNRWGEKIFYSTNINELWDGTYRSHKAPQDVYVYSLSYRNGSRTMYLKGHVVLIR